MLLLSLLFQPYLTLGRVFNAHNIFLRQREFFHCTWKYYVICQKYNDHKMNVKGKNTDITGNRFLTSNFVCLFSSSKSVSMPEHVIY